jgi:hypothetical protein
MWASECLETQGQVSVAWTFVNWVVSWAALHTQRATPLLRERPLVGGQCGVRPYNVFESFAWFAWFVSLAMFVCFSKRGVGMWLLLAEMFLALFIIVFIMWWTMKDADPKLPKPPEANHPPQPPHLPTPPKD